MSGGKTTQKCPLQKGALFLCVIDTRTGQGVASIPVSISGPKKMAASDNTDRGGVFERSGLEPGGYSYVLDPSGADCRDHVFSNLTGRIGAPRGGVGEDLVTITPPAKVVVVVKADREPALTAADVEYFTLPGAEDRRQDGVLTHTYAKLRAGRYRATAQLTGAGWANATLTGEAEVAAGGEAVITLVATRMTWVKFRVHDETSDADLARVVIHVNDLENSEQPMRPSDDAGLTEMGMRERDGSFDVVKAVTREADVLYEFVEVEVE